jgi:hypothetical protein
VPHTEITSVLAAIVASVTTFAVTNVDDLFLLSVFFARREPMRRVMAGQYLGLAGIVVLSMFGFWAALAIPRARCGVRLNLSLDHQRWPDQFHAECVQQCGIASWFGVLPRLDSKLFPFVEESFDLSRWREKPPPKAHLSQHTVHLFVMDGGVSARASFSWHEWIRCTCLVRVPNGMPSNPWSKDKSRKTTGFAFYRVRASGLNRLLPNPA